MKPTGAHPSAPSPLKPTLKRLSVYRFHEQVRGVLQQVHEVLLQRWTVLRDRR